MTNHFDSAKQNNMKKTNPSSENDVVVDLLQHANARQAAPEDVKARIKHQAKVSWQAKVEAKPKRIYWLQFGAAFASLSLMAMLFVLLPNNAVKENNTRLFIAKMSGDVMTQGTIFQQANQYLTKNSIIETQLDGYALINLNGKGTLRVAPNTQLTINGGDDFSLAFGKVYYDSGSYLENKQPIVIRTLYGEVTDIGTQFELIARHEKFEVSVREGLVNVTDDGEVKVIHQEQRLVALESGGFSTEFVSAQDPKWQWINETAPEFALENKSLTEFLDWISREHGYKVNYQNEHVQKLAGVVTLHGNIKGLNFEQALSTVFATTELQFMISDGEITVYR